MRTLHASTLIILSLTSLNTFAQRASFEGASVGLSATLSSPTTEFTTGADQLKGLGWTSVGGGLQGAYSWNVGQASVVSVGATYQLNDISSGEFKSAPDFASLKKKNSYSVYVEPGFKVKEHTLAYAKIGYEGANMRLESTAASVDRDINGASLGFGLRVLLDTHIYVQAEVKQTVYNSTAFNGQPVDFRTSATAGLIGIGYHF